MLLTALALSCMAAMASATSYPTCKTEGGVKLIPFRQNNKLNIYLPCKFFALREQTCGNYKINLSPTNGWFGDRYQLRSLWLGVRRLNDTFHYQGRTTNRMAAISLNHGGEKDLFNQKGDNITESDFLKIKYDDKSVTVYPSDNAFELTFAPWDPANRGQYGKATWSFTCFDTNMVVNTESEQLCGVTTSELKDIAEERLGRQKLYPVVFFNMTFANQDIVQPQGKCQECQKQYVRGKTCKKNIALREEVMKTCHEILYNTLRTQCISLYSCEPLEVFTSCIRWGCGHFFKTPDETSEKHCIAVASKVFFCPPINKAGNLTESIEAADCYKKWPAINPPSDEADPYVEP